MHVIPVIDLQNGLVVRAGGGDRKAYKPIASPLAASADPLAIIEGFLKLYPFDTLYIADLDAIEGGALQKEMLRRIKREFPHLALWVDCGIGGEEELRGFRELSVGDAVLGSESLREPELLAELGIVLSLDFRRGSFLGRPEILSEEMRWSERLIVMSLDKVGASQGPDLERLAQIASRADAPRRIYAAGGVRDAADLKRLAALGIAGALVATALHSGAISACELDALNHN